MWCECDGHAFHRRHSLVLFLWKRKGHHNAPLSYMIWYLEREMCCILPALCQGMLTCMVCISESSRFWRIWPLGRPDGRRRVWSGYLFLTLSLWGYGLTVFLLLLLLSSPFSTSLLSWDSKPFFAFLHLHAVAIPGVLLVEFSKLCLHLCKDSFY